MKNDNKKGFGTRAIHAGNVKDSSFGALTMPIYQTSTFVFDCCEQGARRFALEEGGFIYSRLGNPTSMVLEDKIANLESGEACMVMSSGMGAISSVFWSICRAGSHIVADTTLYGCTYALLAHGMTRYGVEVSFIDTANLDEVKKALKKNTAMVYLETPANPVLKIADLEAVAKIAHDYNPEIKVVCDNTFATPYLQRPLELGLDVVVHSLTKYMNGHGDVIAGAAVGSAEFIKQVRLFGVKDMTGSVLGPQEAFLVLRGLKTFELRMERHCASAKKVADFLVKHPKIEKVYFPGLPSHPGHAIAKKQMSDFGGMIAFEVKGGRAAGSKLLNSLELCTLAVSLGDAETLIEHPASMTHSPYTSEELAEAGIPEGLVRLSVGLENVEDIIADLDMGLNKL
ncbi:MAG: methionine gamma-lyase [Deltaproteobacteria bacterium]|nr:methionine gamma-lyase [Deltaproteobacteria bacterium]